MSTGSPDRVGDLAVDVVEPDFNLIPLPTMLRLPQKKLAFRLTLTMLEILRTVRIEMGGLQRGLVIGLAAGVVALTGGLQGQVPESGRGYSSQDWPLAGGDWTSARYSTLTDISTETVDRLGGAWVTRLEGGASSRATPVVKAGVLYLTAGANVFAIDGRTGETVWRWQPDSAEAGMVPSWQGVGLGEDLVFVGLRSAQVAALRQDTGELVWVESVGSVPQQAGEQVTTAPIHAVGKVFVGVANGDSGGQGRVVALDAATGDIAWTFFVVPRPGEFGHDTWPQDSDVWQVGGGGVWLVGTVDPDLGMVYFATGNPVPMFGGEVREGDNLFTAAVLALDMETGERRWHYQVVRHDIWDADIATPMLLYEVEVDGRPRKALAAMRADGILFLFDRETGEPLIPIEERPVPQDARLLTAATQPFPVGRAHHPRLFVLARQGAAAVRAQLQLLYPAFGGSADRRCARRADSDGAGHADVVQPADRIHLRAGPRACRTRQALRRPVDLGQPPRRLSEARASRVVRCPGGGRSANQHRGLEAGDPGWATRHEWSALDSRRPGVLGFGRRSGRRL